MPNEEIQNLLKSGIEAARGGNKAVARKIFEQVLREDPQNELAWMWLATVLDNPTDRRRALERVISINPNNARAQQALSKLQSVSPETDQVVRSTPPPERVSTPPVSRASLDDLRVAERAGASRSPSLLYIVFLSLAVGLIIGAAALIVMQLSDEDEEEIPTQVSGPPTIIATLEPPTPAVPLVRTVVPGSIERPDLGPTWTPSPTSTPLPSATPTATLLPLEEYEIIFAAADSPVGLSHLFLASADGSNLRPMDIQLAPARIQVEVEATAEGGGEAIGTEEAVEGTPIPEVFEALEFREPAVSPDGTFLAFTVQLAPEVQEIFVMPLPGGAPRQLTTLGGTVTGGAVWSPDGERIAFHSNADGDFDVYLVAADGGTPTNLTQEGNFDERDPAFDPNDNQRLIIASDQATPGELEIWSLPLGSGVPHQLTDDVNSSFMPAVSPDGQMIAFISTRGNDQDLYVMNADGTNERLVSLNDQDWDEFSPAWSSDGIWIMVSTNRENDDVLQLWTVRPDGSQWTKITSGAGPSQDGEWASQN